MYIKKLEKQLKPTKNNSDDGNANSCKKLRFLGRLSTDAKKKLDEIKEQIFYFFLFLSVLMYNPTTSSQLCCKYLQNVQSLHAKQAWSAKTTELNLRNTARKTLDKNVMLALSPKPNTFVCLMWNDNNKETTRR